MVKNKRQKVNFNDIGSSASPNGVRGNDGVSNVDFSPISVSFTVSLFGAKQIEFEFESCVM